MKQNRIIKILILSLIFTSCAASLKTNLTNNFKREKIASDKIFIYYYEDELPKDSKEIGDIKIGDSGFSTKCSKEEVLRDARDAAKFNNSNIVLIDEFITPNFASSCYRLKGRLFYNNSNYMNELWDNNDNVFDINAKYSLVHFICKEEKPNGYTYMKAGLVGGTYTLSYDDEKFKVSEYSVTTKKIEKEGPLLIKGISYTRSGQVEINFKHGQEYFVSVTTHTNLGTRVILEELFALDGKKLKSKIERIEKQIEEAEIQKKVEKEKKELKRQYRKEVRKNN